MDKERERKRIEIKRRYYIKKGRVQPSFVLKETRTAETWINRGARGRVRR